MGLFVLDTDILTLFERGNATVAAHVAQHAPEEIAISVVTVEEQLSGWYAQLRQAKGLEKLAVLLTMDYPRREADAGRREDLREVYGSGAERRTSGE